MVAPSPGEALSARAYTESIFGNAEMSDRQEGQLKEALKISTGGSQVLQQEGPTTTIQRNQ